MLKISNWEHVINAFNNLIIKYLILNATSLNKIQSTYQNYD